MSELPQVNGDRLVVPMHGSTIIKPGTLRAILAGAGLTVDALRDLRRDVHVFSRTIAVQIPANRSTRSPVCRTQSRTQFRSRPGRSCAILTDRNPSKSRDCPQHQSHLVIAGDNLHACSPARFLESNGDRMSPPHDNQNACRSARMRPPVMASRLKWHERIPRSTAGEALARDGPKRVAVRIDGALGDAIDQKLGQHVLQVLLAVPTATQIMKISHLHLAVGMLAQDPQREVPTRFFLFSHVIFLGRLERHGAGY
jgi:hypothetical protein